MCESSKVGEMWESSKVGEMRGSSKVGVMWESSKVGEMWGSSEVGEMRESSKVGEMRESSKVGVMWGSSEVGVMWGSSKVGVMWGKLQGRRDAGKLQGRRDVGKLRGRRDAGKLQGRRDVGKLQGRRDVGKLQGRREQQHQSNANDKPMSKIHEVIPKIMAEVGSISKGRKNQQQNYMFRGIDDAYAAFQPLFAKHGVFVVPSVLKSVREERAAKSGGVLIYTTLDVKHTFFADDGSSLECVTVGEAMDSGDKSSNKAIEKGLPAARKHFIKTNQRKEG